MASQSLTAAISLIINLQWSISAFDTKIKWGDSYTNLINKAKNIISNPTIITIK